MTDQDLYKKRIFQYFHETRFFGKVENPDFQASEKGLLCSDKILISGTLLEDQIIKIMVQVQGCIIATACANILAQSFEGKTIDWINSMEESFFISEIAQIQVQTSRSECATLAFNAIKTALKNRK